MNKNELKEGDIFVSQLSHYHFLNKQGTGFSLNLDNKNKIKNKKLYKNEGFSYENIRLATSEEKHWLETCIELDKFIEYEEAMKTFIPEYVEAISNKHSNSEIIGTIYKTSELPNWVNGHQLNQYWKDYIFHYKTSTKEAYDTQFKTKEVVKVKPFEILSFKYGNGCPYYHTLRYNSFYVQSDQTIKSSTNYTLKEQLDDVNSRNCIIESVINEEGNIFMIDDIITPTITDSPNKGKGFKITGFRLNNDKSMICAITDTHNPYGIGIDKIEHFIEKELSPIQLANIEHTKLAIDYKPIVISQGDSDQLKLKQTGIDSIIIPNETLLEKAKRLYPVGTKCSNFNLGYYCNFTVASEDFYEINRLTNHILVKCPGNGSYSIYNDGQWAKIIEDKPKIGDKFQINNKWNNSFYIITKITDCENSYCEFKNEDGYNCGTVLLKNITIIK